MNDFTAAQSEDSDRSSGASMPGAGAFTRLFPTLPPHDPGGADPFQTLMKLAGTLYDDGKPESDGLVAANRTLPAAYTFFAQFVAHDISLDPSHFGQRSPAALQVSLRTPRLDLDNVYGGDPDQNPAYYVFEKGLHTYRFRIDARCQKLDKLKFLQEDLPRGKNGQAIIPDKRDDQHVIVAQLHLALLKLHNRIMDEELHPKPGEARSAFFEAQQRVRWYYQYVVVEDLLPRLLGGWASSTLKQFRDRWLAAQTSMADPPATSAAVPVEFSIGVYRIGHSTIRSRYQVNGKADPLPIFSAEGSATKPKPVTRPKSLIGGAPLHPTLTVSWDRLLVVPGSEDLVQYARVYGQVLSGTLKKLPADAMVPGGLAEADLERGWRQRVPSGQSVARRLGLPENVVKQGNDPLWYYTMREARNQPNVGPVSAAVMSKVFFDLLFLDPTSYLSMQPTWRPADMPDPRQGLATLLSKAHMPFSDADVYGRPCPHHG